MKRVAFFTLGCKVNQYETQTMIRQFKEEGYEIVSFSNEADIYIVNTCTVTNVADKKSRQTLSKAKKTNPKGIIVAVGCYVQVAGEELSKDDYIDLLVGNNKKSEIVKIVEDYMVHHEHKQYIDGLAMQRNYEELNFASIEEKIRVFIKIQDGCNQFCSYCIIPYTRGRIRSREKDHVLDEVRNIVSKGYKEVVLTGIHLASYGTEFDNYLLIDLLEDIEKIEGVERVRLGSLEPNLVDEAFVLRLAKLNKVCPHFHLSLQSGCDETLKRMNRKYTTKKYKRAVELLRGIYDSPSITTDIIVGFPMESDEEFSKTLEFVKDIEFSDIHVFKYSIRKGTKAAEMEGQIGGEIKNQRSKALITLKEDFFEKYYQLFIGKEVDVLFENDQMIGSKRVLMGHTENYLKVAISYGSDDLVNKICKTYISAYENNLLIGQK